MRIISSKIMNEALAFYNVGAREYLSAIEHITTEEGFYAMLPAIMNLSFSIELFLKSYIDGGWGHDLKKLFKSWEEPEKSLIIDATCQQFALHNDNKNITADDFWTYLERNKLAFKEWRYYYQQGKAVDITFLYDMATVLKNFCQKIQNQSKNTNK